MPGTRSRKGCEECRRRRRKCDEKKPSCGLCLDFDRRCDYTLKVVYGGQKLANASSTESRKKETPTNAIRRQDGGIPRANTPQALIQGALTPLPQNLPNGISLSPRYRRLLSYFSEDILASLSVHPSIHDDLRRGLVPLALESPHLLSACLSLSAAGFQTRGISEIDGVDISRILEHLQSSGISLLRGALGSGQTSESVLVACLIWCLADVFACRQGTTSWRIHLQGLKALIDSNGDYRNFGADHDGASMTARRHLHQLYLSLQTLPYVPAIDNQATLEVGMPTRTESTQKPMVARPDPRVGIDGFLGYSDEVLHVLQEIDRISAKAFKNEDEALLEADELLGRLNGMIRRDNEEPPSIYINTSLSAEHGREFLLCHKVFQKAAVVHIYRKLYHMSSCSAPIQAAIAEMEKMIDEMTQDQPCHTWVAMAMPLFTIGCEAFADEKKAFVLDKINKFDACLGSFHVGIIRQALQDMWRMRAELCDFEGKICAGQLLDALKYNIILF